MKPIPSNFDVSVLCALFQRLFESETRTRLLGGAAEPLYQPAESPGHYHCIHFTRDYFASALHEVAHWCIAGPERRWQVDYGYWYLPDGRDVEQQQRFERVEVRPQALEWIFCAATGHPFRVSADNLNGVTAISESFKRAIWRQAQAYCRDGLQERGLRFARGLQQTFHGADFSDPSIYRYESLR